MARRKTGSAPGPLVEPASGGEATNLSVPPVYMEVEKEIGDAIRGCLAGDPEAFSAIVEAYEKPIFNLAYRMTGDREDARDLTQVVLIKAYRNLARYDSGYRFFTWIYRIAFNETANHLRYCRSRELPPRWSVGEPSPEEDCVSSERSREVQAALMELTEDHRRVVVLRHFRECGYREMAAILEVPEKTVKSRLFSARCRLRQILMQRDIL